MALNLFRNGVQLIPCRKSRESRQWPDTIDFGQHLQRIAGVGNDLRFCVCLEYSLVPNRLPFAVGRLLQHCYRSEHA
jgi:hypothetical protein